MSVVMLRIATSRHLAWVVLAASLAVILSTTPASSAIPAGRGRPIRHASPHGAQVNDQSRRIDANRINMVTTNFGSFAYDLLTGNAGLVWPKGTNQTAVFASGIWLGCTVNGEPRVTVAEYSQEYGPGKMVGGTFDDPNRPAYKVYKVARFSGDPQDTMHVTRPAIYPDDELVHHSWSEYIAGAAPYGAPLRTWRLPYQDVVAPADTDSVDVVGPDVLGDQMLWCVYNDADPSNHTNNAGQTVPLGVEVQQTLFAFNRPDDLGNVVFLRYKILNQGGNALNNLYVSLWSDPDLGTFTDDLVGCDIGRSLGFVYNELAADGIYGTPPPALGYVLLQGPPGASSGQPLGMTAFSKYVNGTDPGSFFETYNYMQGLLPDGSTLINPVTGLPTTYFVSGDPVAATGWLDAVGADRRFLLSSGPGRALPGDTLEIWAAIVVGRGSDNINSVATVRCISDLARSVYQDGFRAPPDSAPACSSSVVAINCPRPASYWGLECSAGGSGQLSLQQLQDVAGFVNTQSTLFDWPSNTLAQLCGTLNTPGSDLRQQARREFAAFLSNYSGSQLNLSIGGGQRIFLNPATGIDCPPLRARVMAELAANSPLAPVIRDAQYLNNILTHRTALEGVNFGLGFFGGGAGEGNNFFGSTLNTLAYPDSFKSVAIRFSHTDRQKCYRYLRLQKSDGSPPASFPTRGYLYSGYYDCNFQVWDVQNKVQLDAAFVEKGLVIDDSGTLSPDTSTTFPSMDRTWDPSDDPIGDREYLFVFNRPYSSTPKDAFRIDGEIQSGNLPVLYVLTAKLRASNDEIDDGDAFLFDWGRPPSPGADSLLVDLESQSLADPIVQQQYSDLIACLSAINAGIGIGPICSSGPTPTLISLVSADAAIDRVALRWYADTPGLTAAVERRASGGEWAEVGRVTADGGGMLRFEDAGVTAGARYDYRLAVTSAGGVEYLGAVTVDVPATAVLAFFRALPAAGRTGLGVSFSVAPGEPVRIEVLDVAGRRLVARDYTDLDPGSHTLVVGEGIRFPSGIYLVRISQGSRRVIGKAAIIR
jgi:hypothetical protein